MYLWQISLEVLEYKHLGNGDLSLNTEPKSLPDVSACRVFWIVLKYLDTETSSKSTLE